MDPLSINVVDLGDNPEVEAPMSVLAPQDPGALLVPRNGNPPYYDIGYEGMPRPLPSFDSFIFEPMVPDSPMRGLRDYELVDPQELPCTRQNSLDSQDSDTSGSRSQNSTTDLSENEMLNDEAEEPGGMLDDVPEEPEEMCGIESRLDLQTYLGKHSTGRLRRQWTSSVHSTIMIPGPVADDDECSINSSDTYSADWDKPRTPSSMATPTATTHRPVAGKRGSDGDIDLDRGEGPSRRLVPTRRSSVPFKRRRISESI